MRICVLAHAVFDGDARIQREAKALAEAGAEVDIYCLYQPNEPYIEVSERIRLIREVRYKRPDTAAAMLAQLLRFFFASFFWVTKNHLKKKYDAIHVHTVPDFQVFAAVIPKLTGAKVVLDMHEILPELYARKFNLATTHWMFRVIKFVEKLSVKFADHVLIASPLFRERVAERTGQGEKIRTLINIPDLSYFEQSESVVKRESEKIRVIYPGTLSELHGVDVAIDAVGRACREKKLDLEFHIYGHGPEEENLRAQVKRLGLENVVQFHKPLKLEDLYAEMRQMDIGLIPKRSGTFADDAMSTKLFEYVAADLPAVVSWTKSDALFFDESMVGFFEAGNAEAMAEKIAEFAENPAMRRAYAENAKEVFKTVNWRIISRTLLTAFNIEVEEEPAVQPVVLEESVLT